MLVANKSDLTGQDEAKKMFEDKRIYFISAKDNTGVDQLKEGIFNSTVNSQLQSENTIVTNSRHFEALQQVSTSIDDIKKGLDNNIPGDLLALDIRRCLHFISEITGDISNDTILDYVFSKFCIGK